MNYSVKVDNGVCSVAMTGEFGFSDNETVRELISDIDNRDESSLNVNLSDLSSIDSAGLGMLLLINEASGKKGKKMALSGPSGQVKKMLEISKFSEIIPVS